MNERFLKLSFRIRGEIVDLEQVLHRLQEGWQRAQTRADDYYLDGVALNLHGLYAGIECLFEQIAAIVDQDLPQGANWHKKLLEQMAIENPGFRPAVISTKSYQELDEYCAFRHVVRMSIPFDSTLPNCNIWSNKHRRCSPVSDRNCWLLPIS